MVQEKPRQEGVWGSMKNSYQGPCLRGSDEISRESGQLGLTLKNSVHSLSMGLHWGPAAPSHCLSCLSVVCHIGKSPVGSE